MSEKETDIKSSPTEIAEKGGNADSPANDMRVKLCAAGDVASDSKAVKTNKTMKTAEKRIALTDILALTRGWAQLAQ